MIINSLKAAGFRILGEPIEIEFPAEGRIGILGQNESGKTTLLQTIEYALYGLRKGAGIEADRENLVTWGKNEAKLEIQFTSGQDTYLLQRVIGAKAGHKASFSQVIDDVPDKSSSLTSLKDIEAKIEQITGMDRDSFAKLIYIKQKDLDALRELAKSKREQLVNKVMGIELFDEAIAKAKIDTSNVEMDLENKTIKCESVSANKDKYEEKKTQKEELETSTASMERDLVEKKTEVDEAKTLLEKYEWLSAFNSNNEVKSSLASQMEQVKKELRRIAESDREADKYKAALDEYKPQVEQLEGLQNSFADLERRIQEAHVVAKEIETKRQTVIQNTGLAQKDLTLLTKDLPGQKQKRLISFLVTLLIAIGLSMTGVVLYWVLLAVGIPVFVIAAYFFYTYFRLDKLLAANTEIGALTNQFDSQNNTVSTLVQNLDHLTSQTKFKSKEEVDNSLAGIKEKMRKETGEETVDGIEALLRNCQITKRELEEADPTRRKAELERDLHEKNDEINELEKTRPASIDKLKHEEKKHKQVKLTYGSLQTEYTTLNGDIQGNKGIVKQLERDLKSLKLDHDYYPVLKQEVEQLENQENLLKKVQFELSETSKELRNKVIPHARFIINQILPTLTDGRYSDFEITEDLKFKVHSNEAGGYKEREIFSGGTQDQFLIALRLAFTQSILDSRVMADKYSLLMDECISSSDDVRKQGIFEVLDAMKKTFSQIFVIAHEDISNFVDNNIVLTRNDHGYTEIRSRSW